MKVQELYLVCLTHGYQCVLPKNEFYLCDATSVKSTVDGLMHSIRSRSPFCDLKETDVDDLQVRILRVMQEQDNVMVENEDQNSLEFEVPISVCNLLHPVRSEIRDWNDYLRLKKKFEPCKNSQTGCNKRTVSTEFYYRLKGETGPGMFNSEKGFSFKTADGREVSMFVEASLIQNDSIEVGILEMDDTKALISTPSIILETERNYTTVKVSDLEKFRKHHTTSR